MRSRLLPAVGPSPRFAVAVAGAAHTAQAYLGSRAVRPGDWARAERWGRPALLGLSVLGLGLGLYYVGLLGVGRPVDARAYFVTGMADPYRSHLSMETNAAYLYSPAFIQAMAPLQGLAFSAFLDFFRGAQVVALTLLAGPLSPAALFWSPVASEINAGNIHLFLGLAIVAGFRWPGLWAFVLLTKVTPGVGLLWFALRREWRSLGIALGATGAIVGVSIFLFGIQPWLTWIAVLEANSQLAHDSSMAIPLPLWFRLVLAAALIVWGARTDRRSVVPIACLIALPWIWFHALSMGLAVLPLALRDWRRRSGNASMGVGPSAGRAAARLPMIGSHDEPLVAPAPVQA